MTDRYVSPADEGRALSIAHSARFNSDPIGQFDQLTDELGPSRAEAIWMRACKIYDDEHAESA